MAYIIEREHRQSLNGREEGSRRYVQRAHYIGSDYGYAWTGTVDPAEATAWPTVKDAEADLDHWPGARIIERDGAPVLPRWADEE